MDLHVATYNIHKGFSHFNRRMVIHELRERLRTLGADIVFLQEVQGTHERHAERLADWPDEPQYEFLADTVWQRFRVRPQRGLRPRPSRQRDPVALSRSSRWRTRTSRRTASSAAACCTARSRCPAGTQPCTACASTSRSRSEAAAGSSRALADASSELVPRRTRRSIVAGDFNDWRSRAGRPPRASARPDRGVRDHRRPPGAQLPEPSAAVPARSHLCARLRRDHAQVHHGHAWCAHLRSRSAHGDA